MDTNGIANPGTGPRTEQKTSATASAVVLDVSDRFNQTEKTEKTSTPEPQTVPLETAVSQLNDYVQTVNRSLEFSIDEDSGQTVVRVFNRDTEELIRQLPAEHTLKLAASLEKHSTQGVLFEAKA